MPTWNCTDHQAARVYTPFRRPINPCPWCELEELKSLNLALQVANQKLLDKNQYFKSMNDAIRLNSINMWKANSGAHKGIARLKRKIKLLEEKLQENST